jgi:hypothetical protein
VPNYLFGGSKVENVWLYTRLSRALGDPDDPALMQAHLEALTRLARADGVTIPPEHIYSEVGSGESLRGRPAIVGLLKTWQRLPAHAGGTLYMVETSRLSRGSNEERGRILDALNHAAITIRTPQRTYQLPRDEFLLGLNQLIDRDELERYRQRVKLKWDTMTREGQIVTGGAPYGYRWDKNLRNLVPVPDEFTIVQALFAGALNYSTRQLAKLYPLRQPLICQILRNPVYSGWPHRHCESYTYSTGCKGTRRLPRDRWLLAEKPGTYPAAVSWELFEEVQQALDARYRDRAKCGFTDGWCRDVLRFVDHTGRTFLASHLESKVGWRVKVLVYALIPPDRPKLYVSRKIVHEQALTMLTAAFQSPCLLEEALRADQARQAVLKGEDAATSRESLLGRLQRLRQQMDDLLRRELEAEEAEERASIARVRESKKLEIRATQEQLDLLLRTPDTTVSLDWLAEERTQLLADFAAVWQTYSEAERRRLVNSVIDHIEVLIEPVPWQRAHRREIVSTAYLPWLESYMSKR